MIYLVIGLLYIVSCFLAYGFMLNLFYHCFFASEADFDENQKLVSKYAYLGPISLFAVVVTMIKASNDEETVRIAEKNNAKIWRLRFTK